MVRKHAADRCQTAISAGPFHLQPFACPSPWRDYHLLRCDLSWLKLCQTMQSVKGTDPNAELFIDDFFPCFVLFAESKIIPSIGSIARPILSSWSLSRPRFQSSKLLLSPLSPYALLNTKNQQVTGGYFSSRFTFKEISPRQDGQSQRTLLLFPLSDYRTIQVIERNRSRTDFSNIEWYRLPPCPEVRFQHLSLSMRRLESRITIGGTSFNLRTLSAYPK